MDASNATSTGRTFRLRQRAEQQRTSSQLAAHDARLSMVRPHETQVFGAGLTPTHPNP